MQGTKFLAHHDRAISFLWGDGSGIQICQEQHCQLKRVLAWLSCPWQWLWYANCWMRRLFWGCRCQCCGGICLKSGWIWRRRTIVGSSVNNGSHIHCSNWIQCPLHFSDPDYSTSEAFSTYFSIWPNPSSYNAKSGRDIQECHRQDDIWNWCHTREHVARGKYESHLSGSEHHYW